MKGDSRLAFDTATEVLGQDKKGTDRRFRFVWKRWRARNRHRTESTWIQRQDRSGDGHDEDTLGWIQKGVIAATSDAYPGPPMARDGRRKLSRANRVKLVQLL